MARLLIKTGFGKQTLELRFGTNRVGRDPDCDFPMIIPRVFQPLRTVLSGEGVLIRDCGSTNGTFVNGDPVKEAWLASGQTVNLGDVELSSSPPRSTLDPSTSASVPNRRWCLKAA